MSRTTADIMEMLTDGRVKGTLTQKQTAWVVSLWSRDAAQPEQMATTGGWHGGATISGNGGVWWWVIWNRYNSTMSFKRHEPTA